MAYQSEQSVEELIAKESDLITTLLEGTESDVITVSESDNFVYTPGDILTSTLWNQSGTIYIQVNGTQTKISGYTYNKFCPNQKGLSTKCVTGCSNTADSQILYYWLERGYTFNLTVTSDDYYRLGSDTTKIYATDNPKNGEGSMSEINELLKKSTQQTSLTSGDFIAALNFYCGLKNNSEYGSSTSTSWSGGVHYAGANAAAFKAAGFDSAFFISTSSSHEIITNGVLNETGYSILREVLDYGEPIRVGIPGHAIYMDGYRKTESGDYEYHLNYGWGIGSSNTNWYTVDGLEELKLTYVHIDLSPDVKVNVTTADSGYTGGSFQRGLERINHIWNDKATTFTFASDLAGKTITIDTKAKITSTVDVSFNNINTAFKVSSSVAFESANAMTFDFKQGGSITVNNSKVDAAIKLTGKEALNISLEDAYIFAGYSTSEITIDPAKIFANGTIPMELLLSVKGHAVKSGDAADNITLTNNSAILGDVDLGAGANTITIDNGSVIYGGFSGAEKTLTVSMLINDKENTGPMIVVNSSDAAANFLTATNSSINVTVSEGIDSQSFELIYGTTASDLRDLKVNLTYNGMTYNLSNYTPSADGNAKLVFQDSKVILTINDNIAPDAPVVTASTEELTNKDVILTAVYPKDSVTNEYSIDGGAWQKYSENGVVMPKNGTVIFRATDAAGNSTQTTYVVGNIDKTAPEKPSVTADITWVTNKDVTLTAKFAADAKINEYSIDGAAWQAYTDKVVVTKNATVSFRSFDAAGNQSEVVTYIVDNIDKTAPEAPRATVDITAPTRGNVTVTATFSAEAVVNEYSINDGEWIEYTGAVVFNNNGVIVFRSLDNLGNESRTQLAITNIDRVAPNAPRVSASITAPTKESVLVSAIFANANDKNEYSFDGENWQIYKNAIRFENNGTVFFRSTDLAGNVGNITTYNVTNIDRTAPESPILNVSNELWTKENITITAAFAKDSVRNEYSIDNGEFIAYNNAIVIEENCNIVVRSTDAAGNISTTEYAVTNIDKDAPVMRFATSSPTAVRSEVTVKADCTDNGSGIKNIQYSFDNIQWFTGDSVTITENKMIHFKVTDNVGNTTLDSVIINDIITEKPAANIAGTNLTQIIGWDAAQGKTGFVAIDGVNAPQWKGVWEWDKNEAAMWRVAGAGHFAGSKTEKDGILLYNANNNTFAAWTDLSRADYGYVSLCHVEDAFNAVSLADMNGNDFDDILIADKNGSFGIVFDGTSYHDVWHVNENETSNWELLGTGNFGTVSDNLIVKNKETHTITLWANNDYSYKTWDWSVINAGYIGDIWEFAAAGDFRGDGIDDIVVRNVFNNEVWIWENGNSSKQHWAGTMGEGFEIESVGDFNGDGIDDLLLREHNTGWGGLGYWASGYAGNWNDLNARVETGISSNFAIIS